jgi:hypothetical protein
LRRRRRKLLQKRNSKKLQKLNKISKTPQLNTRTLRISLRLLREKKRRSKRNLLAKNQR